MSANKRDTADSLFSELMDRTYAATSRMFAFLMVGQWLFAILIALVWSPYGWSGKTHVIHVHVWLALFLGGALSSLPIGLALTKPAAPVTRWVIAIAQMLWSALLIHLSGGRIETHFHVFGSLAFLAFYRDWKVLVPATVVVAGDHLARGILWPESVYGVPNPEWWRFLEHAFWVVFEDVVLVLACLRGVQEVRSLAQRQAALEKALDDLRASQETLTRTEKLAAVGQLAASVGHELRNPLTAIQNAHVYVSRRIEKEPIGADPKVQKFSEIVMRELATCSKIISDLLDFARDRPLLLRPCPLHPLVEEAISLVPKSHVTIRNEVSTELRVPTLDRDQFRQIIINLVQNAVEAIPPDRSGTITVSAEAGDNQPWRVIVKDDGMGIPKEIAAKIFQPLFTTKLKGTGLGLAVVSSMVERHRGTIRVESEAGEGARFVIEIPEVA